MSNIEIKRTTPGVLIEQLTNALREAVGHLDYCGWGDRWERECAHASRLPEQLEAAVRAGESFLSTPDQQQAVSAAQTDQLFLFVTLEGDVECVSDSIRLPVVEIHEASEDLLCDDRGVEDDADSVIVNRVIGPDGAKFSSHVWSVRPPVAWERAVIESWKQKQEKP
jgi:hypothetical protein